MTILLRLYTWLAVLGAGFSFVCFDLAACSPTTPGDDVRTSASALAASDAAAAWPGQDAAAIWTVDFEQDASTATGNAHSLTTLAPPLALFRDSGATVQTSTTTVDTTPGVDEARIGNNGTSQGLVIEEARTNLFTNSRDPGNTAPTATGWSQDQSGTTVTAAYAAGPDGSQTGSRIQIPMTGPATGLVQFFGDEPGTLAPGDTVTFSEWLRPTSGAPPGTGSANPIVQWGVCDNAYHSTWAVNLPGYNGLYVQTVGTQWSRSILQPIPAANGVALAPAPGFQDWGWCGDLWAGVDSNIFAVDQVVDLVQGEKGFFATEPIVTGSSITTRAGDHLEITNGAAAVDGGQLALYVKMFPKGDALTCPSIVDAPGTPCSPGYTAPAYLFYIDRNNYGFFDAASQTVTLAVNGITASSAPPATATPGLFSAQDAVEWYVRAGAGAGLVQLRVNGGAITTLLNQPLSGALSPTTSIDLLSAGTSNQFSCWLADVATYCQAPHTACGGGCTDMLADANNCGACGAVCTGTCSNGVCTDTLATGGTPQYLAVDATNVYWTDDSGDGAVYREPIIGGAPPTVLATGGAPFGIALDATNVYWTDQAAGTILSIPKAGGSSPKLLALSEGGLPMFLAVTGGSVYWTDAVGSVQCVPVAGGATKTLMRSPAGGSPAGIAVDATHVYWADSALGTVSSLVIGGTKPIVLATVAGGAPYALAVDGTRAYWTDDALDTVMSAPLAGTKTPTTLASGRMSPSGIAIDGTSVYVADTESGVSTVPLAGGPVTVLAAGFPIGLAVDTTSIYWTDATSVMRKFPK